MEKEIYVCKRDFNYFVKSSITDGYIYEVKIKRHMEFELVGFDSDYILLYNDGENSEWGDKGADLEIKLNYFMFKDYFI